MTRTLPLLVLTFLAAPAFTMPVAAQEKGHRLAACKSDIDKFCASEPRGQGKIKACLDANKDKLAPDCKAALGS